MTATLDRDAWLKALAESEEPEDPDAIATSEFAAMLGLSRNAAATRLQKLVKLGKAVVARKHMRDKSGRVQTVSAYRLVNAKPTTGREQRTKGKR